MEDEEMMAAMGFSSFGGQKKRKFDQAETPPKPGATSSSGANSTQLGSRPKIAHENVGSLQESAGEDDNTVGEGLEAAQQPGTDAKPKPKQQVATGLADFLARAKSLPDRPAAATPEQDSKLGTQKDDSSVMVSFGGPPITRAELEALRKGVRNDDGDTAYFLPSFVENPWEKLAKHRV